MCAPSSYQTILSKAVKKEWAWGQDSYCIFVLQGGEMHYANLIT